ncbi:hypothetical protein EsH8_IV_000235 [Colletotrichum jinshuiense]
MQHSNETRLPNLWDKAFASLADDDKKQLSLGHGIGQSQYSDLLRAIEEKQLACEKKKWIEYVHRSTGWKGLQDALRRIHDSLENFKEADQVQLPSAYTHLLWAGLKTLLEVSFIDNQMFGTTLDNIEAILGIIVRYTKLEAEVLHRNSDCVEELSAGVIQLYGSVLRYIVQAIRYFGQKQLVPVENTSDSPDVDFCEPLLRFEKHEEKIRNLLGAVQKEGYTIGLSEVYQTISDNVEAYNSWNRRQSGALIPSILNVETPQTKTEYDAVPHFLNSDEIQFTWAAMAAVSMSTSRIFESSISNPNVVGVDNKVVVEGENIEDLDPSELYRRIRPQCMGIIRWILDEGYEIDEATDYSWTAATLICLSELREEVIAAVQRSTELLGLFKLLDRLAGKNNRESFMPPIHKWADSILEAMLRHGASGNILFPDRTTALDRAMKSATMVRKFIANGTDANEDNGKWWPPLVIASKIGDIEVVKALIEGGARVNGNPSPEHHLCNPLHAAIDEQHFEVAKLLLAHGADINHKTRHGVTALLPAVSQANLKSVAWMLDMGASMQGIWETQDMSVFDAVDMDESSGPDVRRLLVRRGCFHVSTADGNQGPRPASEALEDDSFTMKAFDGDLQGVRSILGGSTRLATYHLGEALMAASALGHLDIVEALLVYGVEIDLTDVNGRTALHHAIMRKHFSVANLLTEHGASVLIEDISGSTPFELAIAHGQNATDFIKKHMESFVGLTNNRLPSLNETHPSEALSETAAKVRKFISRFWTGHYRYVEWRLMQQQHWSIGISKLPPQGLPPSAFFYEGGDEDEFSLHGFVDQTGSIWFIKLYPSEGWLFKGEYDARDWMEGHWGRNRKLWFGSFKMLKMPSFLSPD